MKKSKRAPEGLLLRHQVATLLGMTRTGVTHLLERGKLQSTRDAKGRHLFSRADVLEYARLRGRPLRERQEGSTAAKVFEFFREGRDLPDIVIETGLSPALVRQLYAEYKEPLRAGPGIRDIPVPTAEAASNEAARLLAAEALAWADKIARGKKSG